MSDRSLYLKAARDLKGNKGQIEAYESTSHCVVVAGPGSGKTKTLTIKLARMLEEDVEPPRGLACITYSAECARELEQRLAALGLEPGRRIFIGTVHSFSLTQIIMPYAKAAKLGLPDNFRVATQYQRSAALEKAFNQTIGGSENPENWRLSMSVHRTSVLNRSSQAWTQQAQLSPLVIAYEAALRAQGVIDFEDMPLIALRALREHKWIQRALLAKYPILAVDEYQDLGVALHRMVLGLCFHTGIRLFAVGDADQSIYGFTGAHPELLEEIAEREDVQKVHLRLNYRCGSRIVEASEYALGEERGYSAPDDAAEGIIYFHGRTGSYENHADYLFKTLLPQILARNSELKLGQIAVLYPAAWLGNIIANAAQQHNIGFIRSDGNALYPRSNKLMRWLESCAIWCCNGWKTGSPRFAKLLSEAYGLFGEVLTSEDKKSAFQTRLIESLWSRRNSNTNIHNWLTELRDDFVSELAQQTRMGPDDLDTLNKFIERTGPAGDIAGMTLGLFSGFGEGNDRINLSTLHSAKGREFSVVILFGMDEGGIPRRNPSPGALREARRLFYVGFTRAESELHLFYTQSKCSRFVEEVKNRLEQ